MGATIRQLESCSFYFSALQKLLTLVEDRTAHLYFLGTLTTFLPPLIKQRRSSRHFNTQCQEKYVFSLLTCLDVKKKKML